MKRVTIALLALLCLLSFAACSKKQEQAETASPAPAQESQIPADEGEQAEKEGEKEPTATLAPSTNKTVVTKEEAPEVYWDFGIAYHLAGCEDMKEEAQVVTWDLVEQVGLRQCPACNPPQYENYVENNE